MQGGRKEGRKYLFILLLYLLILNCGIDYWTGLDWTGFIQWEETLCLIYLSSGVWAVMVMVMVMVSSHAFH